VRRFSGLLGLYGVILLLFAVVALLVTRAEQRIDVAFIATNAVLGVLLLIAYFSTGIDNLRTFVGERSTRYGTNAVVGSLLFIAILVGLNFIAYRHHRRLDLSSEKVFSLSPQSTQVLQNLTQDLKLEAFVEGGANPEVEELLRNYRDASPKVSFRMVDPDREPELAERYGIKSFNTVRIQYGEASNQVTQPTEENLTNGIIKITRTGARTVCVIEGHGEPDLEDRESEHGFAQLKQALQNETYEVKPVLLATLDAVPKDCSVVVVAGPTRPYLAQELPLLDAYLKGGGRMLFLLPPQKAEEFVAFLKPYGITVGDDVVVDQVVRLFQGPALGLAPLVETYDAQHEITKALKGRTLFPMTRSVSAAEGTPGVKATEIVKTSPSSWAETDLNALFQNQQAQLEPADRKGPVSIAVAAELDLKQLGGTGTDGRIAVIGSSQFADNQNLEGTYFNQDLVLNTIGWLVGQSDLVSIRPRGLRASRVTFTASEGNLIFYLSVLVLPQILLMVGLFVWWRRE
jgi:gliding motility-associatede transport system auxiliary component